MRPQKENPHPKLSIVISRGVCLFREALGCLY